MFWVTKERQRWPHTYTEGKQIVGHTLTCNHTKSVKHARERMTESGKRNCAGDGEEAFPKWRHIHTGVSRGPYTHRYTKTRTRTQSLKCTCLRSALSLSTSPSFCLLPLFGANGLRQPRVIPRSRNVAGTDTGTPSSGEGLQGPEGPELFYTAPRRIKL